MVCFAFAPLVAAGLAGCQSEPDMFQEEEVKANLRQINKAYWAHLGYHQRPPTPEELRIGVQTFHDLDMGRPADEAFMSPRDKQPFVIVYGAGDAERPDAILAYEQQGAEGTRWVITMSQEMKQLTEEEFKKAVFAKNHKPAK